MAGKRGRPRVSSLEVLEEAASELFFEQGYEGTTIDEIAQRAGISRGTFFSYCQSKADVLWIELDRALASVLANGTEAGGSGDVVRIAANALTQAVVPWGAHAPWVLRELAAMGAENALRFSSVERLSPVIERIALLVAFDEGVLPDAPRPRVIACALVAAAAGAVLAWSKLPSGERGTAEDAVSAAVGPIAEAFAR